MTAGGASAGTPAEARGSAGAVVEKGGATFPGIKLLLCENPLPPLPEAIEAAAEELPRSNLYTEPFSGPLRAAIAAHLGADERSVHVNAGSELILRQLFARFGQQAHLLTPTFGLFPHIARRWTATRLRAEDGFALDVSTLTLPPGTTLAVVVNPNNPTGTVFDLRPLPRLLERHPRTRFLVDEAFVDLAGETVAGLVADHPNLVVTRTFSKAHSLAGLRVGYAVASPELTAELDAANDAYPLARPSQAAALATLARMPAIEERVVTLRRWASELSAALAGLGVRTFPTETYFFLADFTPWPAIELARRLADQGVLVRPLDDPALGPGMIRMTTATPVENAQVVEILRSLLQTGP